MRLVKIVSLLLLILVVAHPAFALELKAAKAQLLVGETTTGYLEIVTPPGSTQVQALVADINAKRKAKYKEIAKRNGTKLKDVEMLAGNKAIAKTKPGQMVKRASGDWSTK